MIGRHPSETVRVVGALVVPFLLVFGVYVIAHGHYGPGGGFAGGVVLAVGVVLTRLTTDSSLNLRYFPSWMSIASMGSGIALFLAAAFVPMIAGGEMLDYDAVEGTGLTASRLRYLGIFVVEIGVGAVVFGGILLIFDSLAGSRDVGDPGQDVEHQQHIDAGSR
jgi:multicomponent Na+:H+ antiporter subunit B